MGRREGRGGRRLRPAEGDHRRRHSAATTFTQIATSNSDDPTSQDGGKVGYVTRDIPPTAVSDALWNGTHNKGDIIGPIKGDAGYYVLLYNDQPRRA